MKRYIAEALGTFFLALVALMIENPLAVGMMFMSMVLLSGPISGAHLNPAVSLAMFLRNRLSFVHMIFYFIAQVVGACLVPLLIYFGLGNVIPPKLIPAKVVFLAGSIEFLLTFVFISVILMVTTTARFRDSLFAPLILGFALTGVASVAIGTYNPAIAASSIIANLVGGMQRVGFTEILVYLLLPFVAAIVAAFKFRMFYEETL